MMSASVVQWIGFLLIDQKVMGSNPGRSKGVFFLAKKYINRPVLYLDRQITCPGRNHRT